MGQIRENRRIESVDPGISKAARLRAEVVLVSSVGSHTHQRDVEEDSRVIKAIPRVGMPNG